MVAESVHGHSFVSVIVPVKNEERFIGQCLDALMRLDYPKDRHEVIIVDNNSTDRTREVVQHFEAVRLIEKTIGTIGAVRNYGAAHARGEVLAFLDGDFIPGKEWLHVGCELMHRDEEIGCVGFRLSAPAPDAPWLERTRHRMDSYSKYSGTCSATWLSSGNLIVRRRAFMEVGGFNESLETSEDVDLGHRLNKRCKLVASDAVSMLHLGSDKSVIEFFRKELWRGKSSLRQSLSRPCGIGELVRLLIPVVHVVSIIVLVSSTALSVWGIQRSHLPVFVAGLVTLSGPAFLALRKTRDPLLLPQVAALYFVYLAARGLAIGFFWKRRSG